MTYSADTTVRPILAYSTIILQCQKQQTESVQQCIYQIFMHYSAGLQTTSTMISSFLYKKSQFAWIWQSFDSQACQNSIPLTFDLTIMSRFAKKIWNIRKYLNRKLRQSQSNYQLQNWLFAWERQYNWLNTAQIRTTILTHIIHQ